MSSPASISFLKYVLGDDGHKAFENANHRLPTLGAALAPRTVISWLNTAVMSTYEGEIPGLTNSYITLNKSEDGTFSGAITVDDSVHSFTSADLLHVAAAVTLSLGLGDLQIDPQVKSTDISKLGKSIDMLVKARIVARTVFETLKKPMEKVETPGSAAAPKEPKGFQAPQPPTSVTPNTNQTVKPPMVKKELIIKKSEAHHECPECGLRQFRNDRFVGCLCLRFLSKNTTSIVTPDGDYRLKLGREWDQESVVILMDSLRK